jgi:hypothetical protein
VRISDQAAEQQQVLEREVEHRADDVGDDEHLERREDVAGELDPAGVDRMVRSRRSGAAPRR